MKKSLLFISTLFAAGTLVANATTQINALVYMNFDTIVSGSGATRENSGTAEKVATSLSDQGYTNYAGTGYKAVGSYAYHNSANYMTITNTGISYTQDWTIGFSFVPLSSDKSSYLFNDWAYLLGIGDSTNFINIETTANTVTTKPYDGSAGLYGGGVFADSNFTNNNTLAVGGTARKIALVYSYDSTAKTGTFSLYMDGTLLSTSKAINISSLITTDSNGVSTASISEIRLGSGFGTNDQHLGLYDEFVIYDAALTSTQVSTYLSNGALASPLTIPEPSLFGLFAGTLALGLAGTRRRRGNAKNQ